MSMRGFGGREVREYLGEGCTQLGSHKVGVEFLVEKVVKGVFSAVGEGASEAWGNPTTS